MMLNRIVTLSLTRWRYLGLGVSSLLTLLALARGGIESIVATQKAALAN